jgi:hypothetical protein
MCGTNTSLHWHGLVTAQQARALSVNPCGRAGLLEGIPGIVHPRADQKVPAAMRSP